MSSSSRLPHGDSCEECNYLEELLRKYRVKNEDAKTCRICGRRFNHRKEKLDHVYATHFPEIHRFGF